MKKSNFTKRQRLSGILLGLGLTVLMFSLSMSAVILNGDFWLKQNDKYHHTETFELVSNDDYNSLYHNYIELLKNNQSPDKEFTVTIQSEPSEFVNTFIELEKEQNNPTKITKSVTLNSEYLETISRLSESKGESLKDCVRFQFGLKPINEDGKPVDTVLKVSDIVLTDSDGNTYEYVLRKFYYNKSGALIGQDIEDPQNIEFNTANYLGIVVLGQVKENLTIDLNLSCDVSEYFIESTFTYKEMLTNEQVAKKVGHEENIVTIEERNALYNMGLINIRQKIVAITFFVITVIFAIFVFIKEKRISLLGIGFYAFITAIVITVIVNIVVNFVPGDWGFAFVINLPQNSTTDIILSKQFMADFKAGSIRYFDFTMLLPLFISYFLTKLSKSNKKDENEDYLYQ